MKWKPLAVGALLIFAAAIPTYQAWAHSGATGVVKTRMDHMDEIAASMKAIHRMVRGRVPLDADQVARHADRLANSGGENLTSHFPEGSISGPSEALPVIWEDWETFRELAVRLEREAAQLARIAAADPAGLSTLADPFRAVARTCHTCHEAFRQP